jgi:FdhE protein
MPISEHDQAILDAFQEAADEDSDLREYFEFHRSLYETLASAKAGISASLELADAEALQVRLVEGLPMLSFDQLPLGTDEFAELVSDVAVLLEEHEPDLAGQAMCDGEAGCLDLARRRFEGMQARREEPADVVEATLADISVDLSLNPYLEWAAEFALPHVDQQRWRRTYCPVCGGPPDFSYLEEDAGARYLICSRCSSSWLYHRLGCPFCGNSDHTKVSYYVGDDKAYRLYVCQACHRYLKTVDLRGLARQIFFPVERATTVAMDVAANEAGYR